MQFVPSTQYTKTKTIGKCHNRIMHSRAGLTELSDGSIDVGIKKARHRGEKGVNPSMKNSGFKQRDLNKHLGKFRK